MIHENLCFRNLFAQYVVLENHQNVKGRFTNNRIVTHRKY